ncbi:MAG: LysM peptidoglycan-binding domain-containing protein [Acidimicrobiia bacterium]|nr:LysM peptidoglycan-binding domain-containing protein [Acidimicrobiia bacterium]
MHTRHQSLSLRLLILLTGACAVFLLISGRVEASTPHKAPLEYRVAPGDTLWAIASGLGSDQDIRIVIADIKRLNRLDTSALSTGQSLLIPAG